MTNNETKCMDWNPTVPYGSNEYFTYNQNWWKSHNWENVSNPWESRRGYNSYVCKDCKATHFVDSSD